MWTTGSSLSCISNKCCLLNHVMQNKTFSGKTQNLGNEIQAYNKTLYEILLIYTDLNMEHSLWQERPAIFYMRCPYASEICWKKEVLMVFSTNYIIIFIHLKCQLNPARMQDFVIYTATRNLNYFKMFLFKLNNTYHVLNDIQVCLKGKLQKN